MILTDVRLIASWPPEITSSQRIAVLTTTWRVYKAGSPIAYLWDLGLRKRCPWAQTWRGNLGDMTWYRERAEWFYQKGLIALAYKIQSPDTVTIYFKRRAT